MKSIVATRKDGTSYNVRLKSIDLNSCSYSDLNVSDKDAEIGIGSCWYNCRLTKVSRPGNDIFCVSLSRFNTDLLNAINAPEKMREKDIYIECNEWHSIYKEMLEEAVKEATEKSNKAKFSRIEFVYHTTHKYIRFKWDSGEDINFSDKINELKESLRFVDNDQLSQYESQSPYYDDYSIEYFYSIPASEIDSIINLTAEGLEDANEKRNKAHLSKIQAEERLVNIKNGAIYFHCENRVHNEEVSEPLNSPFPKSGTFTLEHIIESQLFSRVKPYGRYYDQEFLEDCDMFFSSPGWRFGFEAINELSKTNRVFVDNIEVI